MPELPEVEVIKLGLQNHLPGHRINAVKTNRKKLRLSVPLQLIRQQIIGARVSSVERRAKYLLFGTGRATLIVHLVRWRP